MTDALGGTVTFGYDLAGQRVSVTDPNNQTRTVGFDDAGNMTTTVDELGRATDYDYDTAGRRTTSTDARGVTINYSFDAAGQLTGETSPDGTVTYTHDDAGRRTQMTDPTGTTAWVYDPAGRTAGVSTAAGSVTYGYNPAGELVTMTQPAGIVAYTYNGAGGLATLNDLNNNTTLISTDADGRTTQLARANGITTTNTFDPAGRLTTITHADGAETVEEFTYTLDPNGNRTAVTTTAGTETYGLDALNRLISWTDSTGQVTGYSYDAAGNRTTVTTTAGTVTYTIDAAGQLVADSTGITYTYDPAGNLTATSTGDTFTYNSYNRTIAATAGGVSQTYGYDANGIRVTIDGNQQLWDRTGLPLLLEDATDTFTHGPAGVHTTGADYPLADAIGSVRATTTNAGTVTGTAAFDPFGQGTPSGAFGFAGEQTDPTGLIHLRARQYRPALARFTSVDPVQPGTPGTGGWNHYTYTANNPTTWTDPTGESLNGEGIALTPSYAATYALAGVGVTLALAVGLVLQVCLETGTCTGVDLTVPWPGSSGANEGGAVAGSGVSVTAPGPIADLSSEEIAARITAAIEAAALTATLLAGPQVTVYRGVDDKKGKPSLSPSAFRPRAARGELTLSTFEYANVPPGKPWQVSFHLKLPTARFPGLIAGVLGLPNCGAMYTPWAGGEGHWDIGCVPVDSSVELSAYAKLPSTAVVLNPTASA